MVHLGLGNFFRAHQAWYTHHAGHAEEWGIAAFTGRNPAVAQQLSAQDGLYTLIVRGPTGDRPEVVGSLSSVHAARDTAAWIGALSSEAVRLVTTTVTEAGYRRSAHGGLDLTDPDVRRDIEELRAAGAGAGALGAARTAPGKLVSGLAARRRADAGPVSLVPCDNVPDNATMLRRVVLQLADAVDPALAGWIHDHVTFVATMVDRITPRSTSEDRARLLRDTGIDDPACVVTEPFTEWVLSGAFANGRPAWEHVGARFVDEIEPWEQRKLLLLNGSHSLMAYVAPLRGARTVAEAIGDPVVLGWVEQWWDEAQVALPMKPAELAAYRQALLGRYRNPRIRHLLAQIAADGSQKVPIRIVPVVRRARAAGSMPVGAARVLAGWTLHLLGRGEEVTDPAALELRTRIAGAPLPVAVRLVLEHLNLDDADLTAVVVEQTQEMHG
jgi:fructuronate reductase